MKQKLKHVPLWKWLLIIIMVLAMPLFFSFYQDAQLQQTITNISPQNNQ